MFSGIVSGQNVPGAQTLPAAVACMVTLRILGPGPNAARTKTDPSIRF